MTVQHSDGDDGHDQEAALRERTRRETMAIIEKRQGDQERLNKKRYDELQKNQEELMSMISDLKLLITQPRPPKPDAAAAQDENRTAKTMPPRASSTPARRKLETLSFRPEENPTRFRQWIERVVQYQEFYQLPDDDAIAELQWYGGHYLDERLRLKVTTHPTATLQTICHQLVQACLPAGAAQIARRSFTGCRQLDRESGPSFISRFEASAAEFRRLENTTDQDLYNAFISQLNQKYFGELRTDIADSGYLQSIATLATRLLAVFAAVRQISASKGDSEKSFEELTAANNSKRPNHVPINSVNALSDSTWRTCDRAQRPANHDFRKCEHAQKNSYCKKCRVRGHFFKDCPVPAASTVSVADDPSPASEDVGDQTEA